MTTIYVTGPAQLPRRSNADFYPTERTLIRAALDKFAPLDSSQILDIGAGDGRWGRIAREITGAETIVGVEKRQLPCPASFTDWYTADYLKWRDLRYFDLIVSNPPYRIAEAVIRKAWQDLMPGGTMIMLLRLAFQAGVARSMGLWAEMPPVCVGVCSRRPSFYGGGTNGTDYGIYVWRKGQGTPGQWETVLIEYERDQDIPETLGVK